jgi:hypothetical protein
MTKRIAIYARCSNRGAGYRQSKDKARDLLRDGHSEREVSRLLGIGKGTIHRLRDGAA